MFDKLRPDRVLNAVWELAPRDLRESGIRLVLTDLDNTLTDYHGTSPDEAVESWLDGLKAEGIRLTVLSNNHHERVAAFCEPLDIPFVARSGKPGPGALLSVMEAAGVGPSETLLVGDQVFTDIRAAKRAGLTAVLVRPYRMSFLFRLRRLAELPFIIRPRS